MTTSALVTFDAITPIDMGRNIPCKETDGTERMVELYTQHVVPHYGIPTKIISDHNPRLTAKLFKELCNLFGVRRNTSTAYHPQTDGQSERTNQTLETFL
jgi:transposase InsO family protein